MWVLAAVWLFFLVVAALVRLVPRLKRGRVVVLDRPAPGPRARAEEAVDRLVAAGIPAEIVEHADHGLNVFANTRVGGSPRLAERYVVQVPRARAEAASHVV